LKLIEIIKEAEYRVREVPENMNFFLQDLKSQRVKKRMGSGNDNKVLI